MANVARNGRRSTSSSRLVRLAAVLGLGTAGLLAIAACGSEPSGAQQSTSQPTRQPTSTSSASNGGCEVFDAVGLPTGNTASGIETLFSSGRFSRAQPPGDAGQIAVFFQDSIEIALGKDAPISCYWALNLTQQGDLGSRAFWVSIELPVTASPEQAQDIYDELASRGATLVGLSSVQLAGKPAARTLIADIPVGQAKTIGGTLVISGKYAVVQVASSDLPAGIVLPTAQPTSTVIAAVRTPFATPPAGSQPIAQWFERELESALGVGLDISSVIQTSANGQNSMVISLVVTGGNAVLDNAGGRFAGVVNSAGGKITSSINDPTIAIVNFEDMKANGVTGSGSLSFAQGQDTILLIFQY